MWKEYNESSCPALHVSTSCVLLYYYFVLKYVLCARVCVSFHPTYSGQRSTPFGLGLVHRPGSHRREVTQDLLFPLSTHPLRYTPTPGVIRLPHVQDDCSSPLMFRPPSMAGQEQLAILAVLHQHLLVESGGNTINATIILGAPPRNTLPGHTHPKNLTRLLFVQG